MGFLFLVALVDFWVGVVLCIMSGLGKFPASIWQICLVCGLILVGCIIGLHFMSVKEYGDGDGNYSKSDDNEQIEALRKLKKSQ